MTELADVDERAILTYLRARAGGSRDQRSRAVDFLLSRGFTEEQITEALRRETVRLDAQRARIALLEGELDA